MLLSPQISSISKSVLRQLWVHSLRIQTDPLWSNSVNTNLPVHELATTFESITSSISRNKQCSDLTYKFTINQGHQACIEEIYVYIQYCLLPQYGGTAENPKWIQQLVNHSRAV